MRLLVYGGTAFLSRAVAAEGAARGHRVVCACRGVSGTPPAGVRHVAVDRARGETAAGVAVDAVVDVAQRPSWVRAAVAAHPAAHYVFVSTISVYADKRTPNGGPTRLPLLDPVVTDEDPYSSLEAYGGMKVACEATVRDGAGSWLVARPGLIVGPGDPTGRFAYWPERLADRGHPEVLAPGDPGEPTQVVDVRDLASWLVTAAERRVAGIVDAVGPVIRRGELLAQVAAGVGVPDPQLTWVDQGFLAEHRVEPWAGRRSLPLWLPHPDHAGLMAHDAAPAAAAGLGCRPIARTARDTLAWLRSAPDAPRTGLTRAEEAQVLRAWHRRPGRASG